MLSFYKFAAVCRSQRQLNSGTTHLTALREGLEAKCPGEEAAKVCSWSHQPPHTVSGLGLSQGKCRRGELALRTDSTVGKEPAQTYKDFTGLKTLHLGI